MARLVFDLDGTLIDSAPDICLAGNAALEVTGAAPLSVEEARGFVGSGAMVFVERMMAARGLPADLRASIYEAFITAYEGAVHLTQPYSGVVQCLATLQGAGHRLGVCTNKPIAPTRAVLDHLGIAAFFEVVYGGDSLPVRKPDPAPLLAALGDLGTGSALYFGDSEVDAETADRAGVPCLMFSLGYRHKPLRALPHRAAFDDWANVPGLVAGILGEAV